MRILLALIGLGALSIGACGPDTPAINPAPAFATATLPPSPASFPTAHAASPQPTVTAAPISGTTTTQLNLRLDPMSSSTSLGLIPASTSVQIVGKDPGGNWYQIINVAVQPRTAWIAAEYVSVGDKGLIPVSGGPGQPMASVREQINVRGGAGTEFESIGLLSPRDAVQVIGRDSNGTWLQVVYPGSPEGAGWVAASFMEGVATEALPIVAQSGELLGTSTPTGTPPVPTPTVSAAPDDNDSRESPAADVKFSPSGRGALIYSSDVSAPEGDAEDWIRFTPYDTSIRLMLECTGNSTILVELQPGVSASTALEGPRCEESLRLKLPEAGVPYLLRISVSPTEGRLAYVRYVLEIADLH